MDQFSYRVARKQHLRPAVFPIAHHPFAKLFSALIGAAVLSAALPASAQDRVLGADISYWNCGTSSTGISQANWTTAYTTGERVFVFLRATRGGTTGLDQTSGTPGGGSTQTLSQRYDDPRFVQNLIRATTAGMYLGPYHFGRPDVSGNTGTDEADHFIQMAGAWMRPGYLMPMYDQEAGSGSDVVVQFALDFSDRLYSVMGIRPCIYINGNYSSIFQGATQARRDALAKPAAYTPSVVGPAYPMLWDARYSDNTNPDAIPIQTGTPKSTYTVSSGYYGPWDDYGTAEPWSFWQYASTVSIPGFNNVDTSCDSDVSHGDIEYVRNYLVPAVWWNDQSGDWATLTNWNSGQTPVAPVTPPDQATPYATGGLPTARLPGAAGTGPTSGQYDTVILERPNTNITVTLSTGTYNIRKLYMRETLNITGGSLTINYNPTYRPDTNTDVLHGGPISAQFSGPVALSNSAALTVHTLQVDTNCTFTVAGGTLTFNTINLMPHSTAPAKLRLLNDVATYNALSNATAVIKKGSGSGTSGSIDLAGGGRAFNVGNGTNDVDLSIDVPIANGSLTKSGLGTLRLTAANTYANGTTVSSGKLLVSDTSGSGTGTGSVAVNSGGTLGGTGTISGAVTVNSGGTLSPGASLGTLTLNSAPIFNGTNFMEIDRNGGASISDKLVLTAGTLTYGGTLVVTNIGAALQGGETFVLYSAPGYSGAFVSSNLPALGAGLNWYLGKLTNNGTIKVNRKPTTGSLTLTNTPPNALQIPFAAITGNATDPDADTLTVVSINATSANGVALTTDATSITYSSHVAGSDQITYTLSDGHGATATGVVNIVTTSVNPTAQFAGTPTTSNNTVVVHFAGAAGWTYYIDRTTNLVAWKTISTNVAPGNGLIDYTDDFHDLPGPVSPTFYRIWWLP